MSLSMREEYSEWSMQDVLGFFVDGFTFEDGEEVYRYETFFDATNQKVLFKLILKKED